MNRVLAVYEQTEKMLQLLESLKTEETERDDTIAEIDKLIHKRERLIAELKAPYTNEEMAAGRKIIVLNEQLEKEMNLLFNEIKLDMKKVKQSKGQNYSYLNPYGKMKTTDGMYVDNKL